jgi:hypothetical protein
MAEPRSKVAVSPTPRQSGTKWVLDAVYPNGNPAAIRGFRTQSEACEWAGSIRHVKWLRHNRSSLGAQVALATFRLLSESVRISASAALALIAFVQPTLDSVHDARGSRPARAAGKHLTLLLIGLVSFAAPLLAWVGELTSAAKLLPSTRRHGPAARPRALIVAALASATVIFAISRHTEQPVESGRSDRLQIGAATQREQPQSIEAKDVPDPIALLIDQLSSAPATVDPPLDPAVQPTIPHPDRQDEIKGETPITQPPREARASKPAIVGVWVPEPNSCASRHSRDGILAAVISTHGAQAGDTSCTFKHQKQIERDWWMLASCSNAHENWTVNVRLTVSGDRLIWTSKRGSQTYTRCRPDV